MSKFVFLDIRYIVDSIVYFISFMFNILREEVNLNIVLVSVSKFFFCSCFRFRFRFSLNSIIFLFRL